MTQIGRYDCNADTPVQLRRALKGQFHGRWFAISTDMRVRITRAPRGVIDGMSLHYYHTGEAYDLTPQLAEYLVAEGYALIEMRQRQRSSRPRTEDRRRTPSSRS